jgi:hypothetical protein
MGKRENEGGREGGRRNEGGAIRLEKQDESQHWVASPVSKREKSRRRRRKKKTRRRRRRRRKTRRRRRRKGKRRGRRESTGSSLHLSSTVLIGAVSASPVEVVDPGRRSDIATSSLIEERNPELLESSFCAARGVSR